MEIVLLTEGETDTRAVKALVDGIRELKAPAATMTWGGLLTHRCKVLRQKSAEVLRAARATWFILLTDAWCDPAGFRATQQGRSGQRRNAARLTGSCCTGFLQGEI